MSLFVAKNLVKNFGALVATDHVSFEVEHGQLHALIGPNGAGKSTLVNLISGLLPADSGTLELDGVDLTRIGAHKRVAAGLSRCFQITSIFRGQSVLDNLLLAIQAHEGSSFRFVSNRARETHLYDKAYALAQEVELDADLNGLAGELPHGAQRKLDVALAIAASPKLLLLDEPMAGMGPTESAAMVRLIKRLQKRMAILLIEHDMDAVFQLADRISVLVYGRVLTAGSAAEIKGHPKVQEVYLGTETSMTEAEAV